MPLPAMTFQPENLGDTWFKGLTTGQDLIKGGLQAQGQYLANAISQMYGMPTAAAGLKKQQLENQYYGRNIESEIGLRQAQARELAYKLNHPYLFGSNQYQTLLAAYDSMGMGQGSGGGGLPGMPGGGAPGAGAYDNVPNAPQVPSYQGWQPPAMRPNAQMAAVQQAMQNPQVQNLQIPPGSMDVLKQSLPENIAAMLQQAQPPNAQPAQPGMQPGAQPNMQNPFAANGINSKQDILKMMTDEMFADMNYKKTMVDAMRHRLNASSYKDLTPPEKSDVLAQMKGLGFTQDEAVKYLESDPNHTVRTAAAEKGFDPNKPDSWPAKQFAATTSILTSVERSNVANAALKTIEPFVTNGIAPYAKRIDDVSPALLKDIVTDSNVDRASNALAAYALGKETAGLRGRIGNFTVGINYLRDMTEASMSNLNNLKLKPGSEIYKETQRKIDEQLNKMNLAENMAAFNMPSYKQSMQQGGENQNEGITPEEARAELARRRGQQSSGWFDNTDNF